MLPSYTSVMQQQQQEQQGRDAESEQHQPSFHRSYQGLHQEPQSPQHTERDQRQPGQQQSGRTSMKDGALEINLAFLQSPAGGLLAVSSILGLVLGICGAVPLWSMSSGGAFCVFSGLLHFSGASLLFFAYLFNFIQLMPWYTRTLAVYYYLICSGVSLLAFVYGASHSAGYSAAIASAVFAFLAMAVDIVLIVLSYMALKMGYLSVQSAQEVPEA